MAIYRPVIWTQALSDAASAIVTAHRNPDIVSRAREIFHGARIGRPLNSMNCEFVTALRSRFDGIGPQDRALERAFNTAWGDAWDAAGPQAPAVTGAEMETAEELQEVVAAGVQAAGAGKDDDACPYSWDTAQGIIWLQARRLTADRIEETA